MRDPATLQTAAAFCEDFLAADGLALVVHTLQREAIPADVDYESRQGCYAIALQLLRYGGSCEEVEATRNANSFVMLR